MIATTDTRPFPYHFTATFDQRLNDLLAEDSQRQNVGRREIIRMAVARRYGLDDYDIHGEVSKV